MTRILIVLAILSSFAAAAPRPEPRSTKRVGVVPREQIVNSIPPTDKK
jgi:hypothetical protein